MSEAWIPDDLREEYDFSAAELRSAERGRYARRRAEEGRRIPLDPDAVGDEGASAPEQGVRDDPA